MSKRDSETRERLKSCPFCGGPPDTEYSGWSSYISCRDCGAEGSPSDSVLEAINSWNIRVGDTK